MKQPFSQNKSKLGDSIAQRIPFEGESHYLAQSLSQGEYGFHRTLAESAEYASRGYLLLILAVIIILVGGCFAITASSSTAKSVGAAEKLFYLD
jgi:hypothetical protein